MTTGDPPATAHASADPTIPPQAASRPDGLRKGIALVLSGGGVRATSFHVGLLLRLAASGQLGDVKVLSTVSGGSLAAGLTFMLSGLKWPTADEYISQVLPRIEECLTVRSLQGYAVRRTLLNPSNLAKSRGNLFAKALEKVWGINKTLKDIAESPEWFINATCYETGRNWRFSQKHIGDWRFGHNYSQRVELSLAMAASAAIPYMAGFVTLPIQPNGWSKINPATDEPTGPQEPIRSAVRLWDGGVYENLGVEAVYKPDRGLISKLSEFLIVSDASAYVEDDLEAATGILTTTAPFLRSPRLFDIATEQTRALRSRMLVDAFINERAKGVIVRLGRDVPYVYRAAQKSVPSLDFLSQDDVQRAKVYATNALKMNWRSFAVLVRHGFETADATFRAYHPKTFPDAIPWASVVAKLPKEVLLRHSPKN